ncbi:hypothetical protein HHI36_004917 [Cryptolaemus montrouzieri]|uniref:Anoctamin n=1 Tax=Cryptolaemus montrouzieri TaxID=559131 RepID=A0ABD2NSM8_9CUCU
MPKQTVIQSEMTKILEGVMQEDTFKENIGEIVAQTLDSPSLKKDLIIQEELQSQIQLEATCYSVHTEKEKYLEKVVKIEMTIFESDGVRGEYLSAIHDYLLTIKPKSVEVESDFSTACYICSSFRSRSADDTINKVWKRKSNELAFNWGTIGMTSLDEPRANFRGTMEMDPITGKVAPQYPRYVTYVKMYCVSLPIVFLCMLAAFVIMLCSFWAENWSKSFEDPWFATLPSIVYSILVCVMSTYYRKLATFLTEWGEYIDIVLECKPICCL